MQEEVSVSGFSTRETPSTHLREAVNILNALGRSLLSARVFASVMGMTQSGYRKRLSLFQTGRRAPMRNIITAIAMLLAPAASAQGEVHDLIKAVSVGEPT